MAILSATTTSRIRIFRRRWSAIAWSGTFDELLGRLKKTLATMICYWKVSQQIWKKKSKIIPYFINSDYDFLLLLVCQTVMGIQPFFTLLQTFYCFSHQSAVTIQDEYYCFLLFPDICVVSWNIDFKEMLHCQ